MSATTPVTRSLPRHPSEEFLRKEAKRLAHSGELQLATAQRQLAHEYGHRNWAELMRAVQLMASTWAGADDSDPALPPAPPAGTRNAANIYPFLPLRGLVAFPHVSYPIFVGRPASVKAVLDAQTRGVPIVMATQRNAVVAHVTASAMYEVGVIAAVALVLRLPDGTLKTTIEGKQRARISRFIFDQDFSKAEATEIVEPTASGAPTETLIRNVISAFMARQLDKIAEPEDWAVGATSNEQPSVIADRIASRLSMDLAMKQALLEVADPVERLEKLLAYLNASG